MVPFDPSILRPGDAILYRPNTLMGWVIAVKTWTRISHIEIYAGIVPDVRTANGEERRISYASRDGIGVGAYPLRLDNIACVRRPKFPFNFPRAREYFFRTNGQKYDWLGLLSFTLAVSRGTSGRQFCSEFATNLYRFSGGEPFNEALPACTVAPSEYWQTAELLTVWSDGR